MKCFKIISNFRGSMVGWLIMWTNATVWTDWFQFVDKHGRRHKLTCCNWKYQEIYCFAFIVYIPPFLWLPSCLFLISEEQYPSNCNFFPPYEVDWIYLHIIFCLIQDSRFKALIIIYWCKDSYRRLIEKLVYFTS